MPFGVWDPNFVYRDAGTVRGMSFLPKDFYGK